jgi:hypothetical protein
LLVEMEILETQEHAWLAVVVALAQSEVLVM